MSTGRQNECVPLLTDLDCVACDESTTSIVETLDAILGDCISDNRDRSWWLSHHPFTDM